MSTSNLQKMDSILSLFHYNPANLIGPRFKETRRDLMETLTGKRPLAKDCGINNLMDLFYSRVPLRDHTCQAHREELLKYAIAKLCNPAKHAEMIAAKNKRLLEEIEEAEKAGESVSYIAFLKNKLTE